MTGHARLWLPRHVRDDVVAQAQVHTPLETGGILLGYIVSPGTPDAAGAVVVVGALGPGPQAEHDGHLFAPDHDWQVAELADRYERSDGVAGYVGDWHSHPLGTPVPSRQDLRTLRKIARHPAARLAAPTMLIIATLPSQEEEPRLRAWRWAPRPLTGRIGWLALSGATELPIVDVEYPSDFIDGLAK